MLGLLGRVERGDWWCVSELTTPGHAHRETCASASYASTTSWESLTCSFFSTKLPLSLAIPASLLLLLLLLLLRCARACCCCRDCSAVGIQVVSVSVFLSASHRIASPGRACVFPVTRTRAVSLLRNPFIHPSLPPVSNSSLLQTNSCPVRSFSSIPLSCCCSLHCAAVRDRPR